VHFLTKVLVVIGSLLSLFLAALTIAYSSNAETLRRAYEDEKAISAGLAANLKVAESRNSVALADALREAEQARAERSQLQNRISELMNQLAAAQSETKAAQVGRDQAIGQNNTLTETARANSALIAALTDELGKLRSALAEAAKRETELAGRINELDRERTVLQQETRAMREQLTEVRRALEQAQSGGVVAGPGATGRPFEALSGPRIATRVKQVLPNPAGGELVVIGEGANSGVRENMLMTIIRGGDFIANLIITRVDANEAVGRVDKLGRNVTVQADDTVVSRLN
jgi:uncharacterized phage infection (PIP) family protein YhgE